MGNLTPMMQQYLDIKKDYRDTILFYRMGDFYEMFSDDALMASKILGITLTTRDKGKEDAVPMCGVPYHSASSYISRLIRQGIKVAVCEQGEVSAGSKGLVHREVKQVITPGLIIEDDHLVSDHANYLMAVCRDGKKDLFGIAFIDISTGDFRVTETVSFKDFQSEVHRVSPSEVITWDKEIVPEGFYVTVREAVLDKGRARDLLSSHFRTIGVDGLGLKEHETGLVAAGMVLDYIRDTRKAVLPNITALKVYNPGRYMILGANTKRNLELFDSISSDKACT
ncbi:DNA mismatch repair protein MutS, partial [bacterium]|nr:DNA mismatch repair protein MutS [bacterium]